MRLVNGWSSVCAHSLSVSWSDCGKQTAIRALGPFLCFMALPLMTLTYHQRNQSVGCRVVILRHWHVTNPNHVDL